MTSVQTRARWYAESWRTVVVATTVALLGGLLLGGLTSFGQTYLPFELSSFANSAGGWTLLAFVLIRLGRARMLLAGVLGIVAFEALVEGYRIVSGWRGFFYAQPFGGIFSLIGLVAGPVLGVSAALTRWGTPRWRLLGVTPLAAVLAGEGVYGLTVVATTTSPVYWVLQLAGAVAALVIGAVRFRPGRTWVLVSIVVAALGAAVFVIGYVGLGGVLP